MEEREKMLLQTYDDIKFLKKKQMEMAKEIDNFYKATLRMITALNDNKDIDMCLNYWTTLMKDGLDWTNELENGHYKAHVLNLVNMIDQVVLSLNKINP